MGGRSGEGPQPGNWAGGGAVCAGGGGRSWQSVARQTLGTRLAGGAEAAVCARSPRPLPLAPGILFATGPAVSGRRRVRWRGVTNASALGLPASLRRGVRRWQCAPCFGYLEAQLGHRASLPALGEERRSRRSGPRRSAWQERPAPGSGMRQVIAFSPPGRAPRLPDFFPLQNLRAAFGFFLSYARGAGDTIPLGDLLLTLLRPTIHTDTETRCLTQEDAQKRWEARYFLPVGEKNTWQSKSSKPPGWALKEVRSGERPHSFPVVRQWLVCAHSPNYTRQEGATECSGLRKQPSSPTTPAALKSETKEFRIRFQNTAEQSRTNTLQLPRPRREPQRAG